MKKGEYKGKQHQWIAVHQIPLSDEEITTMLATGRLPKEYTVHDAKVSIGCYACEQAASRSLIGTVCPGEPQHYEH